MKHSGRRMSEPQYETAWHFQGSNSLRPDCCVSGQIMSECRVNRDGGRERDTESSVTGQIRETFV